MAEPVRFFLDEHIASLVAQGLRQRGVDVLTADEAGRCGLPDSEQLDFATTERRVTVTFDADYLGLAASGEEHFGICYCHATKYRSSQLLQILLVLHAVMDEESMHNQVEYI